MVTTAKMVKDESNRKEVYDNMRLISSYDILHGLKEKERSWPYSVFLDEARLSSLIQCYDSFEKQPYKSRVPLDPDLGITVTCGNVAHIHFDNCNYREHTYRVRSLIVKFLFEVVDYYNEEREIVTVAMNYLDRFLWTRFIHDDENILIPPCALQDETDVSADYKPAKADKILDICALVCLDIAIKLFSPTSGCPVRGSLKQKELQQQRHDQQHFFRKQRKYPNVDGSVGTISDTMIVYDGNKFASIAQIVAELFSAADLAKIEKLILSTLDYNLHPVTSHSIIGEIFKLANVGTNNDVPGIQDSIVEFAQFQVELGLMDTKTLRYPPSIQAAAAMSNSVQRRLFELISLTNSTSQQSLQRQQQDISEMRVFLHKMELALKISFQFDERVVRLRGVYMELVKSNDKYTSVPNGKADSNVMTSSRLREKKVKRIVREPPENHTKTECDATTNERTFWKDTYHFFNMDFETLFPSTKKTKNGSSDPVGNSDLMDHYNRFIRPKLYGESNDLFGGEDHLTASLTDDSNDHTPLKLPGCSGIAQSKYI